MKTILAAATLVVTIAAALPAKAPSAQIVDAGSFGIYVNGKRVGTETFKVEQRSDVSVARSDLKVQDSGISQHSEMELSSNGNIMHYTWEQVQPTKSELTVEPNDEFLIEKVSAGSDPKDKAYNVPHLLPHSTAILDDNFFLHREILLWRYLASGCTSKSQAVTCKFTPQQFGVLIPAQHAAETVTVDFKDKEKITMKGQQVEVSVFVLQTDNGDWFLDLNDQQKVVRMVAGDANLEVVRD
jgi:hypothetical protein